METTKSMSDGPESRAFYLPGTSVLSAAPGRVERFIQTHLRDHSSSLAGATSSEPAKAFYLPGTSVLTTAWGRAERFLAKRLGNHDLRTRINQAAPEMRDFYLPGSSRLDWRR